MRIASGGVQHETNTFSKNPTTLADFVRDSNCGETLEGGDTIFKRFRDTGSIHGGYISGAESAGFELVPLLCARAQPAGLVEKETFETMLGWFLERLEQARPFDGVLLDLHGAMVAEGFPQADGETVRRVRELMGPKFPIVVTHDYHANVPAQLVQEADALVVYKTNPHVDQRERGLQAAAILVRTIRGEVRPVSALVKPELVYNIYFHNTSQPPMQPLMQAAIELEEEAGILACSIAGGYQYADVPAMGPSIVVVADGDLERAQREAARLGEQLWAVREQLRVAIPGPAAAVEQAMASPEFPVTLLDFGDNIGGGSAGDSTFLLEQLLAQRAESWVVTIYDPEAAQDCVRAGIGGQVALKVGGKLDRMHGPTLDIEGRVRTLHDGTYEETERRHGGERHFDQGLSAVVAVGRSAPGKGGLVVLNSHRSYPNTIHQITCMGIQPQQQKILVAKGAVAPRAAYEPVSVRLIEVDTPGATAIHRAPEEYRLARRNLYEWQREEESGS